MLVTIFFLYRLIFPIFPQAFFSNAFSNCKIVVSNFLICIAEKGYFFCSLKIPAGYFFSKKFAVLGQIYQASSTVLEDIMPFSNWKLMSVSLMLE
jgi:hypothetical protein